MTTTLDLPWLPGVRPNLSTDTGWDPLIEQLNRELLAIDPDYRVVQVKEKFGGLRYYVISSAQASVEARTGVYDLITAAEAKSFEICEVCGDPGTLIEESWLKTRCPKHA